jgi:hypothetical protein
LMQIGMQDDECVQEEKMNRIETQTTY